MREFLDWVKWGESPFRYPLCKWYHFRDWVPTVRKERRGWAQSRCTRHSLNASYCKVLTNLVFTITVNFKGPVCIVSEQGLSLQLRLGRFRTPSSLLHRLIVYKFWCVHHNSSSIFFHMNSFVCVIQGQLLLIDLHFHRDFIFLLLSTPRNCY